MTLIGLLVLALNARNVSVQTHGSGLATRTKLVQSITEGGRLSHDVERLRVVARQMLANVLSCSLGHGDSGLRPHRRRRHRRRRPPRQYGDRRLPRLPLQDGNRKVGSSLHVLPRQRVKDTRADVIKQASGTTYVHPAAHFALTEAELALHAEAPREYSWERDEPAEDDQNEVGAGGGEPEGKASASNDEEDDSKSSVDPDDVGEDAEENAHLDGDLDDHAVAA